MATRLQLQTLLETTLGNRNVYFNPPSTLKLKYPCIVYSLDNIDIRPADDANYITNKRYQITLIDTNPDSQIIDKLIDIPRIEYNRSYKASDLCHFVFRLYY